METAAKEIVYVLTNPAFPELLKLGRTKNLAARLAALSSSTSLPYAFAVAYAARVQNAAYIEQQLHKALDPHRISAKREFFRVPLECVIAIVELVAVETLTPTAKETRRVGAPTTPAKKQDVSPQPAAAAGNPQPRETGPARPRFQGYVLRRLATDGRIPSQVEIEDTTGIPRSTVSDWLAEMETNGLIIRRNAGRCKAILSASPSPLPPSERG